MVWKEFLGVLDVPLGNDGTAHFSGIDGVGDEVRNLTKYARERLDGS